jgi:hypothetical protein
MKQIAFCSKYHAGVSAPFMFLPESKNKMQEEPDYIMKSFHVEMDLKKKKKQFHGP